MGFMAVRGKRRKNDEDPVSAEWGRLRLPQMRRLGLPLKSVFPWFRAFLGLGSSLWRAILVSTLISVSGEDKTLLPWARDRRAVSSYTEVSPSGKGLYIIIASDVPLQGARTDLSSAMQRAVLYRDGQRI